MYQFDFSSHFVKKYKKLSKNNKVLKDKIGDTLKVMSNNPFSVLLLTHKVTSEFDNQKHYSSRVNGDIRIIWDFEFKQIEILEIIDLGGHTGQNKVYK